MNYELAKKLKDAGFPQTGQRPWFCGGHVYYGDGEGFELCKETEPIITTDHYCESSGLVAEFVYEIPTLSELIEACGENFYSLYRHQKDKWQAHSTGDLWDIEIAHGPTPEEAVANLWLALNKK